MNATVTAGRRRAGEPRSRCGCCSRLLHHATHDRCWSCRKGYCARCDAGRPACATCGGRLGRRNLTGMCRPCSRPACGGGCGVGPLPDDPPRMHLYHARAMAGLPLFPEKRRDR